MMIEIDTEGFDAGNELQQLVRACIPWLKSGRTSYLDCGPRTNFLSSAPMAPCNGCEC